MDKLFDAPSGPISPQDIRAAVAEEIRLVLHDLEVKAFWSLRHLCQMSADEIANNDNEQEQQQ